ncbi:PadR family transcriptional regulator [Vagococcus penaei]|uniref:PadR family transcriptional regulator n=1 Tax=Vagococcus penaei TaxID=633807 RepID=A0A1Q2D6U8_9ENTE|nr:PadR family transcriptional regulator [Vagococcus penaei]AQP54021.1 PadR family transcriptional regulator [Vagococcus penaei]RSU01744.1 PadR family transcriptional regulator [Vagococcus penaei]
MKESQLLKGVLEGCVLQIISQKEIYGYELVQQLKIHGFTHIVGGTVYPLLQKLEKQGLIKGQMKKSFEGPNRKYFCLTELGREYLKKFKEQWTDLVQTVTLIIGEENKDDTK